jgi:hypothetical protein
LDGLHLSHHFAAEVAEPGREPAKFLRIDDCLSHRMIPLRGPVTDCPG